MKNDSKLAIAFYLDKPEQPRHRQVIALSGYFVNALSSIGVSRSNIPQWLQSQVDTSSSFNANYPITRQVHGIVLASIVLKLGGNFVE